MVRSLVELTESRITMETKISMWQEVGRPILTMGRDTSWTGVLDWIKRQRVPAFVSLNFLMMEAMQTATSPSHCQAFPTVNWSWKTSFPHSRASSQTLVHGREKRATNSPYFSVISPNDFNLHFGWLVILRTFSHIYWSVLFLLVRNVSLSPLTI